MNTTAENQKTGSNCNGLPIVSVVMITYNHELYIEAAISSVLSQTFLGNFELIIGDDCSTDRTAEIVRQFYKRYPDKIKLVTSPSNVGVNNNFRRCILASSGEYIAFCEGDDFWHDPEKLNKQVRILQSNPDVGAVHSDFDHTILLKNKWKTLKATRWRHGHLIPSGMVLEDLIVDNFIQTCTLCIRSHIAKDYFLLTLPLESYAVGDWPLCIFASAKSSVQYMDESLATYRKTPGSLTNLGYETDMSRSEICIVMITDFCTEFSLPKTLESKSHLVLLKQALFFSLLSGNTKKFEQYWGENRSDRKFFYQKVPAKISKAVIAIPAITSFLPDLPFYI